MCVCVCVCVCVCRYKNPSQKDVEIFSDQISQEHFRGLFGDIAQTVDEFILPASDEKMAAQRRESSKSLQDNSSGTAVQKKDFSACQRNLSRRKQVLSRLQGNKCSKIFPNNELCHIPLKTL